MDIITTGVSRTSADRIKVICDYIKIVHEKFAEKVNFQGLKYSNLFEYMRSKAENGEIGDKTSPFLESELIEALTALEEDGVISRVGHKRNPTIRWIQ